MSFSVGIDLDSRNKRASPPDVLQTLSHLRISAGILIIFNIFSKEVGVGSGKVYGKYSARR